jgi:cation diffusion facilitator CzcD-associated flavoprotein CzcO
LESAGTDSEWEATGATATLWRGDHPVYDRGDTVCVIGAGASGLAAVKNLREQGFAVDCYERETGVGGAWNWRHARSPMYASTHLISSKSGTQYPDFPMPDDWPDYPHHGKVLTYLERYADHFGLKEHVWFGTEVVRVESGDPAAGLWDVTTRVGHTERTSRYAAVVVANGHLWSPKLPRYEGQGQYLGKVIHSSEYKDPAQLRGRRVLVVGGGNSGCDIAVDAAQQANRCWHSTRRGYWYAPKYVLGRPTDQVNDLMGALRLPLRMRQWFGQRELRRTVGDQTRYGLPKPDHKLYESHPIVNSQLVYYCGHGDIEPVPDIKHFTATSVVLTNGEEIEPDLVIMATGYLPRFEFLSPQVLDADRDGRPRLHLYTFSRKYPTLFLAGLAQGDGGLLPIAHWQSVVIAKWLRLRDADPQRAATFWTGIASTPDQRWTHAKTTDSTRHWFELDHTLYLKALQRVLDELESAR